MRTGARAARDRPGQIQIERKIPTGRPARKNAISRRPRGQPRELQNAITRFLMRDEALRATPPACCVSSADQSPSRALLRNENAAAFVAWPFVKPFVDATRIACRLSSVARAQRASKASVVSDITSRNVRENRRATLLTRPASEMHLRLQTGA